ncbi:LPXTG cell wall anchor domain-containing protein [Arcanobacterium hippocoleae]|uniref:LPXTG cell wall anchor domain-containing protein n=1 Tax=Arcanobacterium hippocoleae TaxID=149017 RepID=UPI003605C515
MFGKSNEDTYRARHKVEVSPKCTKLGVKSAMFGSLFALGIPAGSAKAVENPANVLTAESVNAVAASLENGFTVSPANQPRKRGRRAAAPAKLPDPDGGFPPSRKEQIKNENTRFVDVDLYELEWDENITLNGVPVGKVSGRETDPGFMKLSDGKYVYYYDFNTASTLDMGEILKRIKAVPKDKEKSKKLPTYYGRDYFRAKIVVKDFPYKGEGLLWSGAEEIQNHNGEPIDVVYYSKSGYTNYKENLVGTNYERFNSIEKKIVGDKVFNEVSGAKYEGEIVIRHHTMIYQFKDIAKNYSITIQGVDLRAPVVDLANTGKTLGLSSGVHIATADSLDTQFNNSKIDVSDNVTPKNKLQSQAKFSFVDPQNPHKELTLQEVQDAAKKGGFPKHYDVKVAVTDDAGFTAKANDNSAVKLAGTLIVAPAIKLPKETEKVVVLDSASLTPGDKARIIDAVKKANPQNTLLTFPSTKITVDPNNITITYPDGGNSVKVPVKKFIGEIRQTETSSGDAKFMDAVGVETGGRAELVLSGATDVDAVGVETGGRAELVLSGATDVDAVGVETGGRAELVDKPDALVLADESGSSVVAEKLPQTGADQRDGLFGAAALGLAGLFSVFGARKRREEQ